MFAIIAAVIFAVALLLDLADVTISDALSPNTLLFGGLLCLALHLAGVGTGVGVRRRR